MKIAPSALRSVLIEWIDTTVMPKSTAIQKFLLTFVLMETDGRLTEMIERAAPIFTDKEGMIDLDKAQSCAKTALDKAGGTITLPVIGWNFDQEDLETVFKIAKTKAN